MFLSLFFVFGIMLLFAGFASAGSVTENTYSFSEDMIVKPLREIGPTYPGSNITMKPEIIAYSYIDRGTLFILLHASLLRSQYYRVVHSAPYAQRQVQFLLKDRQYQQ